MAEKKKKKNKIWEPPQLLKDVAEGGKLLGTALGVGGAAIFDPVSAATEYATGLKTPRLMKENVREFKRVWGGSNKKPTPRPGLTTAPPQTDLVTPKPTTGTIAREQLGGGREGPLYTNVPSRMSESGALPVPGRSDIGNDRFSNVGSFTFDKPKEEPFKTLSLKEASRRGALVGQTGKQYNLMRESEHTKKMRVGALQRGELALEKEKGAQTPGRYQTDVVEGEDFSQQLAVTGPGGKTKWESPPVARPDITEAGPLEILSSKDFMALPEEQKKAYMARLESNPKEFLALRKALKLDVRK